MVRIPIFKAIRPSPFDRLLQHASKVVECIRSFKNAVENYLEEDFAEFEKQAARVTQLEHEADIIKGNIRAHLPRGIFMPVDKSDFLMLLREQDAILDFAEDAVVWMGMRHTRVPQNLKETIKEHLLKVVETVEALEKVVAKIKTLISLFLTNEARESAKEAVKEVHKKEWEADNIERKISKEIFAIENIDPLSTYHLLHTMYLIDSIANHAENAGDLIRAILAK